jgi:hypothetical protein
MGVVYDFISPAAFWTALLTLHMLASVGLLGAVTHQALAALAPAPRGAGDGVLNRARRVSGPVYAGAVCLLWVIAFVLGGWIYVHYRIYVRVPIEAEGYWLTLGAFEVKEHVAVLGLGLLPLYWLSWQRPRDAGYAAARRWTTGLLAAMTWLLFLVGHVVNNVRGFG